MPVPFGVRPFVESDRDEVRALAPRLTEGVAPWRETRAVLAAVRTWVDRSMDAALDADRAAALFVAVDANGVCGFVSVSEREHFAGDLDAYVGELVVHRHAGRRGVGRALIDVAEGWALARGRTRLTLDTGARNAPAREFYQALGYAEEDIRLSKQL